jgi:hypothetical protein
LVLAVNSRKGHGLPHPNAPNRVLVPPFGVRLAVDRTLGQVVSELLHALPAAVVLCIDYAAIAPPAPLRSSLANTMVSAPFSRVRIV